LEKATVFLRASVLEIVELPMSNLPPATPASRLENSVPTNSTSKPSRLAMSRSSSLS
jgi:hypothetical protein